MSALFTNIHNVPVSLALWLAVDEYAYATNPYTLSATTLLKSPRYIIGKLRERFPEEFPEHLRPIVLDNELADTLIELPDIQSRAHSRIGTAIHGSIEKCWKNPETRILALRNLGYPEDVINKVLINPEPSEINSDSILVYLEQDFKKQIEVDGVTFLVTGQADTIIEGKLHDTKTTGTYTWESGSNDENYKLQGSIYRWLSPETITNDTMAIDFVFKNFQQSKTFAENYPPAQVISKDFELLSLQETEMFIRNKIKLVIKHWNDPLETIPCCTPEQVFRQQSIFKYYKSGYQEGKRSTKNFKSFAEASAYRADKGKNQGEILEHKGTPFMCDFCNPEEVEQMSTQNHSKAQQNRLAIQ